jgi:2-oxoglutarate ferredoxin oxidoreductase subunit alpha
MRKLLIQELEVHPKKLIPVLHYDGTPVTADFIQQHIYQHLNAISQQTLFTV